MSAKHSSRLTVVDRPGDTFTTESPFFSIVMPAYNVDGYIREAVISIKNQVFTDFECIVVDDGSTDKGIQSIDDVVASDDRFTVISQKNGGLSNARNNGFKFSTGRYILFLDSDDLFDATLLEEVYKRLHEVDVDVVIFNHTILDGITGHMSAPLHDFSPVAGKASFNARAISDVIFNIFGNQVWTKAYRRDLLVRNELLFDEDLRRAEDIPFTYAALLLADKLAVIDRALVSYRVNRGNSNSDRLAAHYMDIFTSLDQLHDRIQMLDSAEDYKMSFQNLFVENMNYNLNALVGSDKFKNEFILSKEYALKYEISDRADSYLYDQLFDVSELISNGDSFDMLTYIAVNEKSENIEKQTAIYAKDDVISQKDIEIADITNSYNTLYARYDKLVKNPFINAILLIRSRMRQAVGRTKGE